MRLITVTFALFLFFSIVSSSPLPPEETFVPRLDRSWNSGLKAFFHRLRARFLTKASKKWVETVVTKSPRASAARSQRGGVSQDDSAEYTNFASLTPAHELPVSNMRALGLWEVESASAPTTPRISAAWPGVRKDKVLDTSNSEAADLNLQGAARKDTGLRVSTSKVRSSLEAPSPRSSIARGRELETHPSFSGFRSPRTPALSNIRPLGNSKSHRFNYDSSTPRSIYSPAGTPSLHRLNVGQSSLEHGTSARFSIDEAREQRVSGGSPSMRMFKFADEEHKYPVLRASDEVERIKARVQFRGEYRGSKSERRQKERFPAGWKPEAL